MLYALSITESLAPPGRIPAFRALGSHFKAWLRRDDVEMVIRNLKEHITGNKCYIQFTVSVLFLEIAILYLTRNKGILRC
jgi:hypothetical protein